MKLWEMIVLLFTIIGSAAGVAWLLKGEISDVTISILKTRTDVEASIATTRSVHDLDMSAIRDRLTAGGWSRPEQQRWIDALRPLAGHSIPDLN